MCGFVGIATAGGAPHALSMERLRRLRDDLAHRGPDDSGEWGNQDVLLAHARLAVIDPGPAGHQPMHTPPERDTGEPRFTGVYNGMLYNDAELRSELAARGVTCRVACDTETVVRSFAALGTESFWRLRGMFAAAFYDARERAVTLVRDPLGIKPLYYAVADNQLIFASEPHVVARHPAVGTRINRRMVSAYLTTIRTVLGEETLYEGVRALRPGHYAVWRCAEADGGLEVHRWWGGARAERESLPAEQRERLTNRVRTTVADSVARHLRADVPTCALLSGGLDSSIIVSQAVRWHDRLRTYAAGPPDIEPGTDLDHAARVAEHFGTRHAVATIDRERFSRDWPDMIARQKLPLSTPNEVAIHAVASRLREDGCKVTLSGEGADELFGGYDQPLLAARRFHRAHAVHEHPGVFELTNAAWIPSESKGGLLRPDVWAELDDDAWLRHVYETEFDEAVDEAGENASVDRLQAHLRFQRRINLTGLLQRLDSATMLASVEGRTPIADVAVASLAESLPMTLKFQASDDAETVRTKVALREAFRPVLPEHVVERPKASFPLPFTRWMDGHEDIVRHSWLLREVLTGPAIEAIARTPNRAWNAAWPVINLAYWGEALRGLEPV
jgi:asparagine synthase (glutamine-hydrolysing)